MTAKSLIITLIGKALDDLFRTAKAMPQDKLTWQCGGECRTALQLLQECAQSMKWPQSLLNPEGFSFDSETMEKAMAERAQWTTAEDCERAARANWQDTKAFIENYPEEDLDRVMALPFGPDLKLTVAEILGSPYWNMTYHLGQINYIQLMYGDKEMH